MATVAADAAATTGLCVIGAATGSLWWWALAVAWGALSYRQIKLTARAARYRRESTNP